MSSWRPTLDGRRFGDVTRALRGGFSRRGLLRGAVAGVAAAALGQRPARAQAEPGNHVQAVVSSHAAATEAGLEALAEGGTAADAAVAVAAVLSVVEPWFSSALGGGTWALYYDAEANVVTSLDGVGPVGRKASLSDYGARADSPGIHQAIVPGAWDGWMLWLDRYGRLDLGQVLAPAIRLARDGYPASSEMAWWLSLQAEEILSRPDTLRTYAPSGLFPGAGDLVRQTDMADTFAALAQAYDDASPASRTDAVEAARDYFYRGPLAEAIVDFSDEHGGYLTLEDFRSFAAEIVEPISITFDDGITVFQNPPNSQGITMLLALNILKDMALSGLGPYHPDAVHLQVEAIKLAFADRYHYIGDPDRIEIPVSVLLSEEHAAEQRQRIDMETAMAWPVAGGIARSAPSHTTTFHVVDRYGNAAAVTTSLGGQFLVVGGTGIHINERMQFLSLEEGNANQLTPGYKVRHTSSPYMTLRANRPYILGGNTGVDTQPQGQLQQFLSVVEFGLSAQEAVNQPRFVSTAFPATRYPYAVGNQLQMQAGFPESLVSELIARGHNIVIGEGIFGSANMIVVNEEGTDAQVGAEPNSSTAYGEVVSATS